MAAIQTSLRKPLHCPLCGQSAFPRAIIIIPYYWVAVFTVVAMATEQTHFLLTTVQSCVKERTQSLTRGSSERLRGGWGDTEARVCSCIKWDYYMCCNVHVYCGSF